MNYIYSMLNTNVIISINRNLKIPSNITVYILSYIYKYIYILQYCIIHCRYFDNNQLLT